MRALDSSHTDEHRQLKLLVVYWFPWDAPFLLSCLSLVVNILIITCSSS